MTQEEIIEMAKQAGYFLYDLTETHQKKTVETDEADEWAQLERFAKLIAEAERDECATLCADIGIEARKLWKQRYETHDDGRSNGAFECVEAIRARGEA